MNAEAVAIAGHLGAALTAGGLIGLERSFHGRSAGFRTHALVCLASAMLMVLAHHQEEWLAGLTPNRVETDPVRMAQGIMTGIGFLGAGVIYRDGFSIRGLTTAASVWVTAAIGILMGVGFYFPGIAATVLALGILSAFRWIEARLPSQTFAHHTLRFDRNDALSESEVRGLLREHGFAVTSMSYRIPDDGQHFEYRMIIRTRSLSNMSRLAGTLRQMERVRAFHVSPSGD